jgi:uncharacterized membrane protein YraQ (UPF0718 family)
LPWILIALAAAAAWWLAYSNLERFANWLVYGALGMPTGNRLASAIAFFVFEAPKVLLLLLVVVFGVGIVRSFFTPERTRRMLAGRRQTAGNVLASLLGVVTPFCSCSAVPLFIGFVTTGVPLGVTFSFLIAAPMINEVALVLLFGKLRLERWVEGWVYATAHASSASGTEERMGWAERVSSGRDAVKDIVSRVWPYVLAGIAVGAGIHGYVPEQLMASIMGKGAWWSVPLAVLIGIPMYSNAAGIIPVVQALLEKGAALGTVLAFMMSVFGLSLPEVVILRKVLKLPLIATFVGVVGAGILVVGYLFNFVL